jgi:uncharacterized membrane protein (UPF0182 family)
VIVKFGQSVGIGDTLDQALDQVFKGDSGAPTDETPTTRPPPTGQADNAAATRALQQASVAFSAAEKALASGDLAGYQTRIKQAQAAVQRALTAMGR